MTKCDLLPAELKKAAAALELRLRLLGTPTTKEPMEKWEALSERARAAVPPWLPELSSRYALSGVQLEFPHPTMSDEPPAFLTFLPAEAYRDEFAYEMFELPAIGFHVFADAGNGDLWVTTVEEGPADDVFLFEASSWDGSRPTVDNGLKHAHTCLAALLSIAAIGPLAGSEWSGFAIWFQRRDEAEEMDSRGKMSEMRAREAESRGELAEALAAWRVCEELSKMIAEKYPLLFDHQRRAFRTKVTKAIRRLSGRVS